MDDVKRVKEASLSKLSHGSGFSGVQGQRQEKTSPNKIGASGNTTAALSAQLQFFLQPGAGGSPLPGTPGESQDPDDYGEVDATALLSLSGTGAKSREGSTRTSAFQEMEPRLKRRSLLGSPRGNSQPSSAETLELQLLEDYLQQILPRVVEPIDKRRSSMDDALMGQPGPASLAKLGIDRPTLQAAGLPDLAISRLHRLMAAHAAAFKKMVGEEVNQLRHLVEEQAGGKVAGSALEMMKGPMEQVGLEVEPPCPVPPLPDWPYQDFVKARLREAGIYVGESGPSSEPPGEDPIADVGPSRSNSKRWQSLAGLLDPDNLHRLLQDYQKAFDDMKEQLEIRLRHEAMRGDHLQVKLDQRTQQVAAADAQLDATQRQLQQWQQRSQELATLMESQRSIVEQGRAVSNSLRKQLTEQESTWKTKVAQLEVQHQQEVVAMMKRLQDQSALQAEVLSLKGQLRQVQGDLQQEIAKAAVREVDLQHAQGVAQKAVADHNRSSGALGQAVARAEAAEGLVEAQHARVEQLSHELTSASQHATQLQRQLQGYRQMWEKSRTAQVEVRAQAAALLCRTSSELQHCKDVLDKRTSELDQWKQTAEFRQLELDSVNAQLQANRTHLKQLMTDLDEQQSRVKVVEGQNEQLTLQLKSLSNERDVAEARVQQLQDKMARVNERAADLEVQLQQMTTTAQERTIEANQCRRDWEVADETAKKLQKELEEVTSQLTCLERANTELDALKGAYVEVEKELNQMKKKEEEYHSLEMEVRDRRKQCRQLQQQEEEVKRQLAEEQDKVSSLAHSLEDVQQKYEKTRSDLDITRKELKQVKIQLETATHQLEDSLALNAQLSSELQEVQFRERTAQEQLLQSERDRQQLAAQRDGWMTSFQQVYAQLQDYTNQCDSHGDLLAQRYQRLLLCVSFLQDQVNQNLLDQKKRMTSTRIAGGGLPLPFLQSSGQTLLEIQQQVVALQQLAMVQAHRQKEGFTTALERIQNQLEEHQSRARHWWSHALAEGTKRVSSIFQRPSAGPGGRVSLAQAAVQMMQQHKNSSSQAGTSALSGEGNDNQGARRSSSIGGAIRDSADTLLPVNTDQSCPVSANLPKAQEHALAAPAMEAATTVKVESLPTAPEVAGSQAPCTYQTLADNELPTRVSADSGTSTEGCVASVGVATDESLPAWQLPALSGLISLPAYQQQLLQVAEMQGQLANLEVALSDAVATANTAQQLLEQERQENQSKVQVLESNLHSLETELADLQNEHEVLLGQYGQLKGRDLIKEGLLKDRYVSSLIRRLQEAEWKLQVAAQRAASWGFQFLVPLGRVNRSIQTVYSDIWLQDQQCGAGPEEPETEGREGVAKRMSSTVTTGTLAEPPPHTLTARVTQERSPFLPSTLQQTTISTSTLPPIHKSQSPRTKGGQERSKSAGPAAPTLEGPLGPAAPSPWKWHLEVTSYVGRLPLLTQQQTLKAISNIYSAKVVTDTNAARGHQPLLSLPQFVGQYYEQQYGDRNQSSKALEHLGQLVGSIQTHAPFVKEVQRFERNLQCHTKERSRQQRQSTDEAVQVNTPLDGRHRNTSASNNGENSSSCGSGSTSTTVGIKAANTDSGGSRAQCTSPHPVPFTAWQGPPASSTEGMDPLVAAGGGEWCSLDRGKVRPKLPNVVPHSCQGALAKLLTHPGVAAVAMFTSSGDFLDHLQEGLLGRPLSDVQAPHLHFILQETSDILGIHPLPHLYLSEGATPRVHLFHVPLSWKTNESLTSGSSIRGGHLPPSASSPYSWRRQAVLVITLALAQWSNPQAIQAAVAGALAPMVTAGGGGRGILDEDIMMARAKPLPALADLATVVSLMRLQPEALLPHLPKEVQGMWSSLAPVLEQIQLICACCGDRTGLLVVQDLKPVLAAMAQLSSPQGGGQAIIGDVDQLVKMAADSSSSRTSLHLLLRDTPDQTDPHTLLMARAREISAWSMSQEYREVMATAPPLHCIKILDGDSGTKRDSS